MSAPGPAPAAFRLSPVLLALDALGALLLGLGAAEHFGKVALLSAWTGRADAPLIAMALGGLAMVIAAAGIVRAAMARAKSRAGARP